LTSATPAKQRFEREDALLWSFIVTPVLAWIAAQQLSFLAASSICTSGHRWVLYLVMGSALAVAASTGVASWTKWKALASRRSVGRIASYRHFVALGGVFLSGLCTVSIVALLIPATLHRLCD
jgi:hypothetical protein